MKWALFDYGEVLCHAQSETDRHRLVDASGIDGDHFWRGYWEHRLEFDRGTLTAGAYWSQVLDRTATEAEVDRLVGLDVESWSRARQDTVEILAEVRAFGHPVALLSNAPICVADHVDRLPWIQSMNARFYSGHLRLVKPDAEIYLRVAAELGAAPGDVVFVDDRQVNVEGAQAAGMPAIHFRDAETLRDDLTIALASPGEMP